MPPKLPDTSKVKHYVLDTNVVIHDPQAMFRFKDNADTFRSKCWRNWIVSVEVNDPGRECS